MNAQITKQLERLRNHATLYELVMTRGNERILIAYSSGKGRTDIWRSVTSDKRVKAIIAKAGTENLTFGKKVVDGAMMGEWKINFTGRTQREAISEGELPYIAD